MGGRLGWGNLGFRSWVHTIERCSRGGLLGANSQNRAVRARFGQTTCKGGLYCGKGDLGVVGEVQLNGVGAVIGLVHSRGGAGFTHLVSLSPCLFLSLSHSPKPHLTLYPLSLFPPGGLRIGRVHLWWVVVEENTWRTQVDRFRT